MANISKCQDNLLRLAENQGYLTFDDILNASDTFSLSVTEVDYLSEALQLRGIIVYETAPQVGQSVESDEEIIDYSRTDYEPIFKELLQIAPQLSNLIEEIRLYPAPQYGEVNQLARQAAEGNHFARERMIMLYMRSVLKIALSMSKQYELDVEDAISSGFMGLINAVDKYDPSGFSAFTSYASLWIQQGIQRDCNPVWLDFYFPAHFKEKMFRSIQKYEQYSCDEAEIDLDIIKQIAFEIDLSEDDVEKSLNYYISQKYQKKSIEEIIDKELSSDDIMPNELISRDEIMFEELYQKDLSAVIEGKLAILTEREASVIRMRYGINCSKSMTLEEIGSILHVTRERIRQIEAKAMRKLTKPNLKKGLDSYL